MQDNDDLVFANSAQRTWKVEQVADVAQIGVEPRRRLKSVAPVTHVGHRAVVLEPEADITVAPSKFRHTPFAETQPGHDGVGHRAMQTGRDATGVEDESPSAGHAICKRSRCLAIERSIRSRFALVQATVRRRPSSRRVSASNPNSCCALRVLPTRRPARSHPRCG